jgi:two-component system, response regulator PdtaR
MRILLADDEALTRMGLRAMLQDMGHSVVASAADGLSAVRLACETRPELAILDIKMPGLDGLGAAQAIASQCPLAVVLLTAYSERDLVERAAATACVQAYLIKPVREADLAPVLELAVRRFAEWQSVRDEAFGLQEAMAARESIDRAKAVLMKQMGLSEGEAFLEIQRRARRRQTPMRRVAEEIVSADAAPGPSTEA